jgi:hypothetical protein
MPQTIRPDNSIFICLLLRKKLRRAKTRTNAARLIQFLDLKPLTYGGDDNMAKETQIKS